MRHPKAKGYTNRTMKQRALAPVVAAVDRDNTRVTSTEGTQRAGEVLEISHLQSLTKRQKRDDAHRQ